MIPEIVANPLESPPKGGFFLFNNEKNYSLCADCLSLNRIMCRGWTY